MSAKSLKIVLYLLRRDNFYAWNCTLKNASGDELADLELVNRAGWPVIDTPSDANLAKIARGCLKGGSGIQNGWYTSAEVDAAEVWVRRGNIANQSALNALRESGKITANFGDAAAVGFAPEPVGSDPAEPAAL